MNQMKLVIEITKALKNEGGGKSLISVETTNLIIELANSFILDQQIVKPNKKLLLITEGSTTVQLFNNFKDFKTWFQENYASELSGKTFTDINAEFLEIHHQLGEAKKQLIYADQFQNKKKPKIN